MTASPETVPSETSLVRVEARALDRPLLEHEPGIVLREAARAAAALQEVLASKPHKFMIRGKQYLEFEDWQTVGRFYGITARAEDPEFVEFPGGVKGFKAAAVAIRGDEVLSRAVAFCLSDEEKWGERPKYEYHYVLHDGTTQAEDPGRDRIVWEPNPSKPGKMRPKKERVFLGMEAVPLFQIASMAQTRACAKALRNVLSWVVVLAGYGATPAEEIEAMAEAPAEDRDDPGYGQPPPGKRVEPEIEDTRTVTVEKMGGAKVTQKEAEALVVAVAHAGYRVETVENRKGAVFSGEFLGPLGLGSEEKAIALYMLCQNRAIYEKAMAALAVAAEQKVRA